jgi:hypothetical protein
MEQLAFFVQKSFEYSNTTNRVLEIIKMTTKFDDEILDKTNESDEQVNSRVINDYDTVSVIDEEEESVEIDITDTEIKTLPPPLVISKTTSEICDQKSDKITEKSLSPLPLIRLNRDGSKHVTKNWLISDCPKKKQTSSSTSSSDNQENSLSDIIRVEHLLAKKHLVRAKPVELLKQIREINNTSPLQHKTNENLKMEMEIEDDNKICAGKKGGARQEN